MAEALAIAASVAGLLTIASQIYTTVRGLASSIANAPQSAIATLKTIGDMKLALALLKDLIDEIADLPPERKAMIRLDHITITFSHCMATLSELESLVLDCHSFGNYVDRVIWARREDKVMALLPRLESQKSSLSLMVSLLQW